MNAQRWRVILLCAAITVLGAATSWSSGNNITFFDRADSVSVMLDLGNSQLCDPSSVTTGATQATTSTCIMRSGWAGYESMVAYIVEPPGAPNAGSVRAKVSVTLLRSCSLCCPCPNTDREYTTITVTSARGGAIVPPTDWPPGGWPLIVADGTPQSINHALRPASPGDVYGYPSMDIAIQSELSFPRFTDRNQGLPGVVYAVGAWGDYDNDGDLDFVLSGHTGATPITRLYRNDAGTLVDTSTPLVGTNGGVSTWGDYDNDGDLDLLVTGQGATMPIAKIYRNDGNGVFTDIAAALPGVSLSSAAWGDCDGDGDLDLLFTGDNFSGEGRIARVYSNDGHGVFTDVNAGMVGVDWGAVAWGDYDNDGDLDALVTGRGSTSRIYRNDGHAVFVDSGAALPAVYRSAVAWGDYDNDGDLDILLSGANGDLTQLVTGVWRNDGGGVFTDIRAGLPGLYSGSVTWADCDNDGDLDIMLTGYAASGSLTCIYRNDGAGVFVDTNAGLPGVGLGTASLADYDGDGDLDLALAGDTGSGYIARLYRSDGAPPNTPPTSPDGPWSVDVVGGNVTLTWTPSGDAQTPSRGLSYNLRVGTTPGGSEICAPMANSSTGFRRVVQLGNAQQRTAWTFHMPQVGFISWSVQAIDAAYAGSRFSPERFFGPVPVLPCLYSIDALPASIRVAWYAAQPIAGSATVYRREVSTDWVELGKITADDTGYLRYEDAAVEPGTRYGYRLGTSSAEGEVYSDDSWAEVPKEPLVFALERISPNPARGGALTVQFNLPDGSPARLELLDVRGRRLVERTIVGPGHHSIDLGQTKRIASGVYFVRLIQGSKMRIERAAMVQ